MTLTRSTLLVLTLLGHAGIVFGATFLWLWFRSEGATGSLPLGIGALAFGVGLVAWTLRHRVMPDKH